MTQIFVLLAALLEGHLAVLGAHILIEIVSSTHGFLLFVFRAQGLRMLVEVAFFVLMALPLFSRVKPLVADDNVVVCQVLRLEAAEEDVVLLELVLAQ